jgi:5-methylcytosine-specific restriction endonuclease McrA
MELYHSSQAYLFNLRTTSSAEAKRIWRRKIRERWDHKCAYCGSEERITIDHIVPQSKGGLDYTYNVVACCESCNQSKSHSHGGNGMRIKSSLLKQEKMLLLTGWNLIIQ